MSFLAEVEELKKSPMPEVRRTIALKVAEYFNNGVFDGNELQIASDIIRLMAKDAEVRVRKALADTLKNNPELPHDIALYMPMTYGTLPILFLNFRLSLPKVT